MYKLHKPVVDVSLLFVTETKAKGHNIVIVYQNTV